MALKEKGKTGKYTIEYLNGLLCDEFVGNITDEDRAIGEELGIFDLCLCKRDKRLSELTGKKLPETWEICWTCKKKELIAAGKYKE